MRNNDGALAGVKVLDLTHALAGPFCTMILADLGADVVKVEHPNGGDLTRRNGRIGNFSTYFGSVNRGKRGILLDLKNSAGQEVAKRLADQADVLAVNFSPGVVERMGLDYASLAARNPRLIYAICSGYGQTGRWAKRQGIDPIIQAVSGIMNITGEPDGPPVRVGYSIGDMGGGVFLAMGILSALFERERSGKGQLLDIALMDCQLAFMENPIVTYLATGKITQRTGSRHPRTVLTRIYPTKDGNIMAGFSKRNWETACHKVLDHPQWATDPLFDSADNLQKIEAILNEVMRTDSTDSWLKKLDAAGIPAMRVNTVADVVEEQQVRDREMIQETIDSNGRQLKVVASPIKLSRTPARIRGAAPLLGEHTGVVLSEWLGMEADEQAQFAGKGAFQKGATSEHSIS